MLQKSQNFRDQVRFLPESRNRFQRFSTIIGLRRCLSRFGSNWRCFRLGAERRYRVARPFLGYRPAWRRDPFADLDEKGPACHDCGHPCADLFEQRRGLEPEPTGRGQLIKRRAVPFRQEIVLLQLAFELP